MTPTGGDTLNDNINNDNHTSETNNNEDDINQRQVIMYVHIMCLLNF